MLDICPFNKGDPCAPSINLIGALWETRDYIIGFLLYFMDFQFPFGVSVIKQDRMRSNFISACKYTYSSNFQHSKTLCNVDFCKLLLQGKIWFKAWNMHLKLYCLTLYKERPLFQQETKIKRDVYALLPHHTLVQNLDEIQKPPYPLDVFLVSLIETSNETLVS